MFRQENSKGVFMETACIRQNICLLLPLLGEIKYFVEWAVACASCVFVLKHQVDVAVIFFQKMKLM